MAVREVELTYIKVGKFGDRDSQKGKDISVTFKKLEIMGSVKVEFRICPSINKG